MTPEGVEVGSPAQGQRVGCRHARTLMGGWQCLFFGTLESSNTPHPDPAGTSP